MTEQLTGMSNDPHFIVPDLHNPHFATLNPKFAFCRNTTTESLFTTGTFTNSFEITGDDMYHCWLMTYGVPLG
jgi:hypothetical protein